MLTRTEIRELDAEVESFCWRNMNYAQTGEYRPGGVTYNLVSFESPDGAVWTAQADRALNGWVTAAVGGMSDGYRGGVFGTIGGLSGSRAEAIADMISRAQADYRTAMGC